MEKVFARKASGLVRSVSAWDSLIYNLLVMAPTAVYIYGIWASILFPGVDLPLTALIAIPVCIVIGIFYAFYSAAMPRSGGDYVWVSRVLHPALGFMMNFFLFVVLLSVAGSYIPWFIQWGITPIFQFVGQSAVANTLTTTTATFVVALVYFLICALIVSRGARATAIALWVFFALTIIGFLVYTGTLVATGPQAFKATFDAVSGMKYDQVIAAAKVAGYPGTFSAEATSLGVIFTIINFLGFNCSVYIAGEIKEVRKAQFIAIIGAVAIFGIITWAVYQATYYAMGAQFVTSIAYLAGIGDPSYKLPFAVPFFQFLFMYATSSPLLYGLALFGWSMMTLAAILTYIFTSVRLVFAWSFDRVFPTALSEVDSRYGSPYRALILVTILAIVFQALWLFTPVLSYFVYIVTGWFITTAIASISGIIFPYRRKDIFETAPSIVRAKIGRVYWITILAVLSLIISAWMAYAGLMPAISGAVNPVSVAFSFGVFVIGLVIYAVSWLYHRGKIPLELSFKEIPPE